MNLLRIGSIAALAVVGIAATAVPAAAETVDRASLTFAPEEEVVATCVGETGESVEIGLGFDLTRNLHTFHDRDGNVIQVKRNVVYVGYFQRLDTGEQYRFRGSRVVTMDLVDATFTSVGAYRVVTVPGEGAVFLEAGRYVEDLDVMGLFYAESGPKFAEFDEGGDEVSCGLFGLAVADDQES